MKTLALLFAIALPFSLSKPSYRENQAGNTALREGKNDEALRHYDEALRTAPFADAVRLNRGSALFASGKMEEAIAEYQRAWGSKDPRVKQGAAYDLGNAFFKQQKYPEALAAYKKALEIDRNDRDAKYNIEVIQRLLEDPERQKQKNEQSKQDPNQDQGQGGGSQGENEEKKEPQPSSNPPEDKSGSGSENQEQPQQGNEGRADRREAGITQAEAERILDAVKEDERELVKARMKTKRRRVPGGKDW